MALTRAKKTEKVTALASELEHSTSAIIGTFYRGSPQPRTSTCARPSAGPAAATTWSRTSWRRAPRKGTKIEAALQGLKGVSSVAYTSRRSGRPGQGALHLGQGQRGVHLQAGHRRRQGHHGRRDQGPGHDAGQGRALLQAALPHPVARAAPGYGHQRHRPRSGRRHQPGRRKGQVSPAAAAAPAAEAPAAEAAAPVAEAASGKLRSQLLQPQVEAAHTEEAAAGEQPSGAAQPENATASQAGEAAGHRSGGRRIKFRFLLSGALCLGATET